MEDAVSRSSLDSSSTGDEYVLVNADPKLRITGDIDDIHSEICSENQTNGRGRLSRSKMMGDSVSEKEIGNVIPSSLSVDVLNANNNGETEKEVGSVSLPTTPTGDCIIFNGVTYLGCATVNAPRSEVEIYRNMAVLNEESQSVIPVVLSVPATADGTVRLLDPNSNSEIASYKIHRILFCARGPVESSEKRCFAFTFSHGDTAETAIFQCHVFRCDLPEAVAKILYCFANTFRRVPKKHSHTSTPAAEADLDFVFAVNLDFKEEDGKGGFTPCPRDKNVFKLRCNLDKQIAITVSQTAGKELKIERCFGLLVCPGRNVKHADMHLIEMSSMGYSGDDVLYSVSGNWDPTEPCFEVLNTQTPTDRRVFMTVAIDLVIHGIQEPVRFAMETKAIIFIQTERFWYYSKKPHTEYFHVKLKEVEDVNGTTCHEVVTVASQTEIDRKKAGMTLNFTHSKYIPENIQTPSEGPDEESDGDEPLLSGSGMVSKEITDENLLEAWHDVLKKWHQNLSQRPKQVHHLSRKGIPEALRGEVWQLLTGCQNSQELQEDYRILMTKETPCEGVISRDINRTFPAHDYFKEAGGIGQDSLYKISKAYSVYDEEIGYCQGQSFLAAALLLHMPEEQAFGVLVKIMFDYGLRDFFRNDFEMLHLHFYQLERLLQDTLPELYEHLIEMNLEAHMYASQWFLTLFTAKFPLHMVFHILDIFLSEGKNVIFSIAMALLKVSRKDLLALDFEGVLKYFRVQLPKRFRSEEATKDLIQTAVGLKVSSKKLKKYEKEYQSIREQECQQEDPIERVELGDKMLTLSSMENLIVQCNQQEDPIERVERENKRLMEANMRLEQENDDMAHELVESKLNLGKKLDEAQDTAESLTAELIQTKKKLAETEEEKQRLETESQQLKEMCRRELDRLDSENKRNAIIIADYKQICSQLSERLEKQQTSSRDELQAIKSQVTSCSTCSMMFNEEGNAGLLTRSDTNRAVLPQKMSQVSSCSTCSKMFDDEGKVHLPEPKIDPVSINPRVMDLERQVRELELELAQTKLALVESECKTQDLTHQLNNAVTEIQASKNTWFHKTINSIKEVTNVQKKDGGTITRRDSGSSGSLKRKDSATKES